MKELAIAIIIVVFGVIASIGVGLLLLNKSARDAERSRQFQIDLCLADSYEAYTGDWATRCKQFNLPNDCRLLNIGGAVDRIEDAKKERDTVCLTRY